MKINVKQTAFKLNEFNTIIGKGPDDNDQRLIKIDIMQGGLGEKKRQDAEQSASLTSLVPVPQAQEATK